MHESMLNFVRRRLVVLTVVATVLLFTFHVIYTGTGLAAADRLPSLIHGLLPGAHTIGASQNASRTSVDNNVNVQPTFGLSEPARTSETGPKSSTVPQPVPPPKLLIVARTKSENTDWIQSNLPDWQTAIYTVDDDDAPLRARNKGHEASVYLTYIVDNYNFLPDVMIFIHSHQKHKHGTRAERIYEGIDYDNLESIRALRLDFVLQNGFANLRCLNNPGCPSEIQVFRPEAEWDPLRPQERAMAAAWKELFQNNDVPAILAAPCCAQFAVSRTQVQQRSKAEYERFRSWLYDTPLDDPTSGRVFEYLWHVIFAKDPVYCPEEEQCYADQYGSSSVLIHQFQNETERG